MPAFIEEIGKLLQFDLPTEIVLLINLALGIILLFFGLKVVRLWLALTGLAGGAYLGLLLVNKLELSSPVSWIVIILLAFAGAFVLALAYKACFFIGGFIAGIYFGGYLLNVFFTDYQRLAVLVIALLCALLALFLRKRFTIVITALTGAFLTADSILAYFYELKPGDLLFRMQNLELQLKFSEDLLILLGMLILAAIGMLVQSKQKKGRFYA